MKQPLALFFVLLGIVSNLQAHTLKIESNCHQEIIKALPKAVAKGFWSKSEAGLRHFDFKNNIIYQYREASDSAFLTVQDYPKQLSTDFEIPEKGCALKKVSSTPLKSRKPAGGGQFSDENL
ncbi:MAG: hypothetical protein ACK5Y2_06920 [Bdellovibrionales bacterium]